VVEAANRCTAVIHVESSGKSQSDADLVYSYNLLRLALDYSIRDDCFPKSH